MINAWRSDFGDEYTDRNNYDWKKRTPLYKEILSDLVIKDILEIGSNRGKNLQALSQLGYSVMGVEPNVKARKEAESLDILTFPGQANDIPFGSNTFDLVFTCGVLIHVPPKELTKSMEEIIRVSRKYILAIEYEAPAETMVIYRGKRDMLWKRPFGKLYKKLGIKLVKHGKTDIDKCHFWLFEKP